MIEHTGWSRDLRVTADGRGVVALAGSVGLRMLADRPGLTAGLSRVLARRGFTPVHDRGRVMADLAVAVARRPRHRRHRGHARPAGPARPGGLGHHRTARIG